MANQIVSVHAGIYGMGIYVIMLPSSGFSVAHYVYIMQVQWIIKYNENKDSPGILMNIDFDKAFDKN